MNRSSLHIGIVDLTRSGWTASGSYTRMLAWSLGQAGREAGVEVTLFRRASTNVSGGELPVNLVDWNECCEFPGEGVVRRLLALPPKSGPWRGERQLRRLFRLPESWSVYSQARERGVSVLLPWWQSHPSPGIAGIGWIPDFQHVFLPDYFPEAERCRRDREFRQLAERSALVMLSSHDALAHFQAFCPSHAAKGRVAAFPSLFAFDPPTDEPRRALAKFHLPDKFALVCNQFSPYKNHCLVVEAVARLRQKGLRVPVVMTGLPAEHSDPGNPTISKVLQAIAEEDLHGQVIVLGLVSRSEMASLMRAAAVVVQPSRFEGWSTIIQDAQALGRPLLCSDLRVHREQSPGALGYFPVDRADLLADQLQIHWSGLEPGPCPQREATHLASEREFARKHGALLLTMCEEAHTLSVSRAAVRRSRQAAPTGVSFSPG